MAAPKKTKKADEKQLCIKLVHDDHRCIKEAPHEGEPHECQGGIQS